METLQCPSPINLKRKSEDPSIEDGKRIKLESTSPKPEPADNNNYKTVEDDGECEEVVEESFSDSEVAEDKPDRSAEGSTPMRCEMFQKYQPWLLKAYGDLKKTKTISLKKYDRIVRTLRGLIPNMAENSKFRFWIRSKGFCLSPPNSSGDQELFVACTRANGETSYKRVAVVEKFFDIIYSIHVELEGRGGRHAGQKKTYRAITESYAFIPREAVTKFLLGCVECQRRSDVDLSTSDKSKTPSTPNTKHDTNTHTNPCDQTVPSSSSSANPGSEPSPLGARPDHSSDESRASSSGQDTLERVDYNDTPKSAPLPANLSMIRRRIPLMHLDAKFPDKTCSVIKKSGFPGLSPEPTLEHTLRLSTSTPDSNRSKSISCSDTTISKSSDSSTATDISPIEAEHFQKPYPKKFYTIHPTTFETIRIPLKDTEISIYYDDKNKPYIKPKKRFDVDWPLDPLPPGPDERPILSTYLRYMRSLGYPDEESLKLDSEAVSTIPVVGVDCY